MDKVAIVTGASRGIGLATATELVARRFKVVVSSTDAGDIAKVAAALGPNAVGVKCDVSKPRECGKMFDAAEEKFGGASFLVNNAGVGFYKPLADTGDLELERSIDVNVKGVLYCCREAAKRFGRGAIVNVSSFYGKTASRNTAVYSASKFAVMGAGKALSAELYPKVKVFTVCPGAIDTRMLREGFGFRGKALPPEKVGKVIADLLENWETTDSGTVVDVLR